MKVTITIDDTELQMYVRPIDAALMVANSLGLPSTELDQTPGRSVFTASSEDINSPRVVTGTGKNADLACISFIVKASQ